MNCVLCAGVLNERIPMFKLDQKPTKIGTVKGRTYYEHPELGDECELIIKVTGGWEFSDFWQLPNEEEV